MEQDDFKHHADILKQMLQDKRKEVEELEMRWKDANRKVRGDWNTHTGKTK